jgi:hypothetical protein
MLKIRQIIRIPKLFLNFYRLSFFIATQSNFFINYCTHYTHINGIVTLAGIRDMVPENLIIYGVYGTLEMNVISIGSKQLDIFIRYG